MRRFLPLAALLGVALVLGCQDLAPVGPDGLVPQFARKGKGKPPSGDVGAIVTLGNGMTTGGDALLLVGKYDDNTVTINTNNFDGTITIDFAQTPICDVYTGQNGDTDGELTLTDEESAYLQEQLQMPVGVTGGSFFLEIPLTGLTAEGDSQDVGYLLSVGYEGQIADPGGTLHTVSTSVRFGWVGPVTVEWVSHTEVRDVFKFSGPLFVAVGGADGRKGKRGRRAIACDPHDDNYATVTVDRV